MSRSAATAAVVVAVAVVAAMVMPAAGQGAPSGSPAPPYKNHTVAGADGWFFNATSNTTSGNYSDWAAGETFYLGDYLSTSIACFSICSSVLLPLMQTCSS